MSRNVTLLQLRTDIAAQCDFSIGTTSRYTPTLLNRLINQSIQRFRERISNEGITHFLVSASGALSIGPTGDYAFRTLDLSALNPAVVRTYGIDIKISNVVKSLAHRPFTERNEFTVGPDLTGQPVAWAHFQTASVAIMPAPDAAYPYTVWYLPVLPDLSADGDTFDGVAGWEVWVLWDCVCQLIARDQYQAAYAQAISERDIVWQDIVRSSTKVSAAGGAFVGRDTLGQAGLWGARQKGREIAAGAGGGSSIPAESSITNDMLVQRTGPVVLGRLLTTTGAVQDIPPPSLTSYMGKFAGSYPGLVPSGTGNPSDSLRGDGTWGSVSGGGGGGPTMLAAAPAGAVQYNGGSGFAGTSGMMFDPAQAALTVGGRFGLKPMGFPTGFGDKLAGWTASGFANVATGIAIVGSGQALAFGANTSGSGILRLSDFQEANWFTNGFAKRIFGVGGLDVSFGDGVGTGLGDNYYDVAAQGIHVFRTKFGNRVLISGSGIIMQANTKITQQGGQEWSSSGIALAGKDMAAVRRINGVEGQKAFGDLSSASATGTVNVNAGSGSVFHITASVPQLLALQPSAIHGDAILIQNRSAATHTVYNLGTGMGAPSGEIFRINPSGAAWARFGSGAWELASRYQLGSG